MAKMHWRSRGSSRSTPVTNSRVKTGAHAYLPITIMAMTVFVPEDSQGPIVRKRGRGATKVSQSFIAAAGYLQSNLPLKRQPDYK